MLAKQLPVEPHLRAVVHGFKLDSNRPASPMPGCFKARAIPSDPLVIGLVWQDLPGVRDSHPGLRRRASFHLFEPPSAFAMIFRVEAKRPVIERHNNRPQFQGTLRDSELLGAEPWGHHAKCGASKCDLLQESSTREFAHGFLLSDRPGLRGLGL